MIRLYTWTAVPNFGDALSKDVVEWVSKRRVSIVEAGAHRKLLAVGSVLQHHARSGDVIWGTGVHPHGYEEFWKNPAKSKLQLHVLAVRGPITRDVLLARQISCPEVYGDPAILLPLVYPRAVVASRHAVLIPHFNDYAYFGSSASASLGLPVVNPGDDWHAVVDAITSAKMVISSSLHGIIVAEAYGVPAIWYRPNQGEGYLKYQDYYGSTQRAPFPVNELRQALEMIPPPPPNYAQMRRRLIDAYDGKLVDSICADDAPDR
jgi:pyruvyltransferase